MSCKLGIVVAKLSRTGILQGDPTKPEGQIQFIIFVSHFWKTFIRFLEIWIVHFGLRSTSQDAIMWIAYMEDVEAAGCWDCAEWKAAL